MHQYQERDGEEDRKPGGHVKRREEGHMIRRMLAAPVPGKRRRGRQKTRWEDSCKTESLGLKEEDALGRTKWKDDIQYHSGDSRRRDKPQEKKNNMLTDSCHSPYECLCLGDRIAQFLVERLGQQK